MKSILSISGSILLYIGFLSCNNSSVSGHAAGTDSVTAQTSSQGKTTCCFVSVDEGQVFFPAGDSVFEPLDSNGALGELNCSESGDSPSSFSKVYKSGDARFTIRINEFCSNPHRSVMDYDLKKKNIGSLYGKDAQFREFSDESGHWNGFTAWSPRENTAYLQAIVDERFTVMVTGIRCKSADAVSQLFSRIPLDKLVSFKKN